MTARLRPASIVYLLREYAIVVAFAVLFVTLTIGSDAFFTTDNFKNLAEQNAPIGIIAVGGTLVIIAGGFDLSVGAIYALAGIAAAKVTNLVDPAVGMLAGLMVGALAGAVNGFLTTAVRINPLIATISTGLIIRGIAVTTTSGFVISVSDLSFQDLGTGEFLGLRWVIWLFVVFALVCGFLLHKTTLGRYIFAAGGNAEAARLAGIRVNWVRGFAFTMSGLAAALAGIAAASSIGSGQSDVGAGLELTAIAAIVVGGTSISGGIGSVWRTVVGVFFLALINNGLNLLGIDPTYQTIVQGSIILIAVGIDSLTRNAAT
jgi:ribose transport system permease protein